MKCDEGRVLGSLQKATRALWFTDALLWNFPSTKPLLGCSEQRSTQTFPGDKLWTERQILVNFYRGAIESAIKWHGASRPKTERLYSR